MHRQWLVKSLAGVAALGLLAAGCGDDDDDDTASQPGTDTEEAADGSDEGAEDVAAYCQAELAIETAPPPDIDFASASEEEISAGMQAYASEVMRPLADDIVPVAPTEIAEEIDVLSGTVDEVASTGDVSLFDGPEFRAAQDTVHQFDLANCGWSSQEVTATDYSFAGIPDDLPAGVTSFEFTNDGNELHELLLVRKNDGVTLSADELLALPEEEARELVTNVGEPAFAAPGDSGYAVYDLDPGDYLALCFIPTGMTSEDGPPPEGPPHAMQGMVAELTVT